MSTSRRRSAVLPLTLVALSAASACVDEKIVYRDRDLFEDPLAAAGGFLGYSDSQTKLTVCGNCHVEKQGDWSGTAHADAWAGLQASSAAQGFCEGCHSVSELGNTVTDVAGYNATGEARYHDVQCESCHGPGLAHATNPVDANVPLPPVAVGVNLTQGCGECHTGTHQPFVEEWSQSRHALMDPYPQTRPECESCHTAEGALAIYAPNAEYLEQATVEGSTTQNLPITCAVCHDPHNASHPGQLRLAIDQPDVDRNLCMTCHHKRGTPDLGTAGTSTRSPHSPQGPLLLGEIGDVGWTPPNFGYNVNRIRGTHGSVANSMLCAGCHVNSYEATDPATGGHLFTVTGHRFLPTPCVDASNVPTEDQSCGYTTAERNFSSCTTSGCHGDEDAALSAMLSARADIASRAAQLDALLAQVDPSQFSATDTVFTVAEGARFNQQLADPVNFPGAAIHNPFMMRALLLASIQAIEDTYGPFPTSSNVSEELGALVNRWGH
jgi:predicted CXXCH cytochrome family protein